VAIIEKLRYLASTDFATTDFSDEEKELYHVAKTFLLSDEAQAEKNAIKLFHTTTNNEIKGIAGSFILNLLVWQERFDELSLYGIPRNQQEAAAISLYNVKETKAELTKKVDCLDLQPSEVGWAIVTVDINGHKVDLMVDTGAGITVINESTATQCGVVLSDTINEALEAQDSLENKLVLPTAMIDSILIGESTFAKKLCMVIPDSALDFGDVKINGTIGWELIRQLKWVFKFEEGKVYVSSPALESVCRNMAYDMFPIVRVEIAGKIMYMGLDTGATTTMFGKSMEGNYDNMEQSSTKSGGAGGYKEEASIVIPEIEIDFGEGSVLLNNINLVTDNEKSKSGFFITPGILGIDIAQRNTFTLDYFNRHISVQ
jgi:predicted aspartyl protease